ncbi:hypothetical protein Tco_0032058 [Tanacetum coccineum]
MNRQLLDSQGPIPGMTPTQALTAIQTMADHSEKWHDRTLSKNVINNSNTDGLNAIVNKLDNLGHDMKNLKENVHAIQVGCQIYKGPHLDKECPLNRKSNRNQSPSLENLETQIEQLTKELQSRTTNGAPSSYTRQCKVVNADHKTPNIPNSSSKLNNLHRVSNAQRDQNKEERATKVYDVSKLLGKSKEARTLRYLNLVVPLKKVGDETVHKELGDRMERVATTASSLEAEHDSGSGPRCQDTILGDVDVQTRFETTSKQFNDAPLSKVNTFGSGEDSMQLMELMDGVRAITTTIDGKDKIITEASIRRHLRLQDSEGLTSLPNA